MTAQQVKQRFGIIGSSPVLDRAIETAIQVAPTDLSVLITGESGSGKEVMPQIIHQLSARKHGTYVAINCGAIPEGTIDSELFGHEKGSFTGASGERKGYFEVANGGTIFLDEVAELPIQTQVRLLRVLETGEFIKVGSSKVQKTDIRVVAATNVNVPEAISKGKFREDLYYRLNTVPIIVPPLRERKGDIHLLFRKFASDFSEKYRMPGVKLDENAQNVLINHRWPGNIRQLKNITEQISIIEQNRTISAETLIHYLPTYRNDNLPVLFNKEESKETFSDRDLLYKVLFEMKKDMTDLKKLVADLIKHGGKIDLSSENAQIVQKLYDDESLSISDDTTLHLTSNNSLENTEDTPKIIEPYTSDHFQEPTHIIEESLSLEDKEIELIKKALEKYRGKRKYAAKELGISERTLYRKIKEYNLYSVYYYFSFVVIICSIITGCSVNYGFTGTSIPSDVKTVSISYFDSRAPLAKPTLGNIITEAIKDEFQAQTNLSLVSKYGDLQFEGYISDYKTSPVAIQGDETAAKNRLTISLFVKFTNLNDPKQNFETTFSRYSEYSTTQSLSAVEDDLIADINEQLIQDIFNKSVSNW